MAWNSSRMQSSSGMFENHTVARQVRKKRRKRFSDESDVSDESEEDEADYHNDAYEQFRLQVFEVIIESLLKEMKNRYDVVRSLEAKFAFLIMEEEAITKQSLSFAEEYVVNVSGDLVSEIIYPRYYPSIRFLNCLAEENLEGLFPNACVHGIANFLYITCVSRWGRAFFQCIIYLFIYNIDYCNIVYVIPNGECTRVHNRSS